MDAAAASMTAPVERTLPLTEDDWEALTRRIAEIEQEREEMGAPASPPSSWFEDAWTLAENMGPNPADEYQLWELQLCHRRMMKERRRRRLGYERRHLGRLRKPSRDDPMGTKNDYEASWLAQQDFITDRVVAIPQCRTKSTGADVPPKPPGRPRTYPGRRCPMPVGPAAAGPCNYTRGINGGEQTSNRSKKAAEAEG